MPTNEVIPEMPVAATSPRAQVNEPDRNAARRQQILRAAQSLFIGKGFGATTVDAICAKARISKRDFYCVFNDREEVFLAFAKSLTRSPAQFGERLSGPLTVVLPKVSERIQAGTIDPMSVAAFRASILAGNLSPALGRAVYETRVASGADIAQYLDEAAARGEVRFDDAGLTTQRFSYLVLDGLRELTGTPAPSEPEQQRHAIEITTVFLEGHGAPALRTRPDVGLPRIDNPPPPEARRIERRSRISESRWDGVLTVAWDEFRERGYDDASMETLSSKVGIPKNTIYRRFGSKAGIFSESCHRVIDRLFAAPPRVDWDSLTIVEALDQVALQLMRTFCHADSVAVHRLLIVEAGQSPEVTVAIYAYLQQRVQLALAPIFDAMGKNGLLRNVDPQTAAWRFFVLATFGSRFLFVPPTADNEFKLASEAVATFLFGIGHRPALPTT